MDSRKLTHFVALAEELHFLRAAERVHLTQSALTRSIQALETQLGTKLFDRYSPKLTLTPVGQVMLSRAKELLLDMRSLQREIALMLECSMGSVAIGAGPFPAASLMGSMLSQLAQEHPNTHVELKINNWAILLNTLLDEEIEFFIADVRSLPDDPRIDISLLGRQSIGFACRSGHPLAHRNMQGPDEILAYPIAAPTTPPEFQAQLNRYLHVGSSNYQPFLVCDSPSLLVSIGLNSDAVIMTTHDSLRHELAAGSMVNLDLPEQPALFVEMGIVRLTKRSLSPLADWIIRTLGANMAKLS